MKYADLPAQFYSEVDPAKFPDAQLLWFNGVLADSLGLDQDVYRAKEGLAILSGASTLSGEAALAMAYSGHQFGHYAPLLGDGRARLVAEIITPSGGTHDIHLKGAGQTPYSRRGDGRATLGAVIREALLSEAMAAMGVPTTRALAIVTTGETVHRQTPETGAILARTAKAHVRVGSFQFAAANLGEDGVKSLADWTLNRLYPHLTDAPNPYLALFEAVCERQAQLIAQWMSLGFIHGVMNTDNMMLSAETVDYGPCAFMDNFHPDKVFSSIDYYGRYAWQKQADIGQWNLARLAESLLPLITEAEAQIALAKYVEVFSQNFSQIFLNKLGINSHIEENFSDFINQIFTLLTHERLDFTSFFTHLTRLARDEVEPDPKWSTDWVESWQDIRDHSPTSLIKMQKANPVRIPRNHQVQRAINAANAGDMSVFHALMAAIAHPFDEDDKYMAYETPPEDAEVVRETFCGT